MWQRSRIGSMGVKLAILDRVTRDGLKVMCNWAMQQSQGRENNNNNNILEVLTMWPVG